MTDTKEQAAGMLALIAKRAEALEAGGELLEPDDVDLEQYLPRRPKPKGAEDEERARAESALPRGDRSE